MEDSEKGHPLTAPLPPLCALFAHHCANPLCPLRRDLIPTIDHRPQKRYSLLIIHYSLFPMSLQFSARFYNPGHRLKSISGRFGSFIFRTHTSGLITAFYKPKKSTNVESLSVHSRSVFESLSVQLREISDMLGLKITSITTNLPTYETHNP